MDKRNRGNPQGTEDPESKNHGKYKGGSGQGAGASAFLENGQPYVIYDEEDCSKNSWYNWNSTLKPAHECIVLARKSPSEKNIVENVLKWGTGGINISATRVLLEGENLEKEGDLGRYPPNFLLCHDVNCEFIGYKEVTSDGHHSGRVPEGGGLYNLGLRPQEDLGNIHAENGLEKIEQWECINGCPIKLLDNQSGVRKSGGNITDSGSSTTENVYGKYKSRSLVGHKDKGTASRFFPKFSVEDYDLFYYCPKASRSERELGCETLIEGARTWLRNSYRDRIGPMAGRGAPGLKCKSCNKWKNSGNPCKCEAPEFEQVQFEKKQVGNVHPSVKPIKLMKWLVKLITPPGGTVLDPFLGSGSTLCAAVSEGFNCIGIEREEEYIKIANTRIEYWSKQFKEEKFEQKKLF